MNEVRRGSLIFKDPGDIKFHISAVLQIISDCGELGGKMLNREKSRGL